MATKYQFYSIVAERTVKDLTDRRGNWMRFLDTAARLYKYPFSDQMMIYAQRPDIVACAPLEMWNEKFDRWVRRGSKGIALIDDTGERPRLKYVFDVADTEPSRFNARPVHIWEMRQEHREAVLTELAKSYDDIGDTLAESFHNIARQLATEYYEDNARDIRFRAEDSHLEAQPAYDFAGSPIEDADDGILEAAFVDALTKSVAYTLMSRCGLDTSEHFEDEDFQVITDFNTPDMVYALGTAASDLSAQVLRDIESVIKKYERLHAAERSEQDHGYDRNPYLHDAGGLSSPGHQVGRTPGRVSGADRQIRQNEESVPQRTQADQLHPPADDRKAVPAPAGSRANGDGAARTDDGSPNRTEHAARQGNRPDSVDGENELAESASGGNGSPRTDLRIDQPAQGAAETAAPFSMAELAQYHSNWNEYIKNSVLSDGKVLNAAVNNSKRTTIFEIVNSIKYFHAKLNRSILDSTEIRKGDLWRELDSYISKNRTPPLEEQLYDAIIQSDAYKEQLAKNETPSEQETPETGGVTPAAESAPQTYSQLGNRSITELLSTSSITMDEVDSILRDGGNFDTDKLNQFPYNSRSTLRIAAYFAKNLDDNADFLKREYLMGQYKHSPKETGKGYVFGSKQVSVWYADEGIRLAVGNTVSGTRGSVLITWEQAADRVKELFDAGQYVSHDVLDEALYNESKERADDVVEVYGNISRGLGDIRYELKKAMDEEQKKTVEDDWRDRRYLIRGLTDLDRRADELLNGENKATPDEIMQFYNEVINLSEPIPEEWLFDKCHPEVDERMTELLRDKGELTESEVSQGLGFSELSEYALIVNRLREDIVALADEPDAPIRFYRNPHRLLRELEIAGLPAHGFPVAEIPTVSFTRFITEDEIDASLLRGGNYSEGSFRFLSHFLHEHTPKERIDFVKHEYGHGGGTYSEINGWRDAEPGKGLTLKRGNLSNPEARVDLNWNTVIKRTEKLIKEGRYMTQAELDYLPKYERLMLIRQVNSFFYELPIEYDRPFAGKTGFFYNEYRDESGAKTLDFTYPHEAEWQAISDLLDNQERLDALYAQMQYIFENTPDTDRYYNSRKGAFESLTAFRNGTYTLFPGLDKLPKPGTVRRFHDHVNTSREPLSLSDIPTQGAEQLSFFGLTEPALPTVEEQRAKIDQTLRDEAERINEAEVNTPALSLSVDVDEPFLNISAEDKARIAAQFTDNPRSREAVNLVREIYGDRLGMPLPQAVKRITELADEGRLAVVAEPPQVEAVKNDPIPYKIGDNLTYDGKAHKLLSIIGDKVTIRSELAADLGRGYFNALVDFNRTDFERMLSDGEIKIRQPEPITESAVKTSDDHLNAIDLILIDGTDAEVRKQHIMDFLTDKRRSPGEAARFIRDEFGATPPVERLKDYGISSWESASYGIAISPVEGDRYAIGWEYVGDRAKRLINSGLYTKTIAEYIAVGQPVEQPSAVTSVEAEQTPEPPQAEAVKLDPLQECARIKQENGGAIVMWQVGDFFEMYNDDAKTAAVTLNVAMTQRLWSGEPQVGLLTGIPRHTLSDNLRKLNEAGYAVAVASVGANDKRNITVYNAKPPIEQIPYKIGDRFIYNGKPHEIEDISDFVKVKNLGTPSAYPIFDFVSFRKYDFERMLSDGELTIEPPEAAAELSEPERRLYRVGDTVYLERNKPFIITDISDFSGEVKLQDPSLSFPVLRSESKEVFEQLITRHKGNERFIEHFTADLEKVNADVLDVLSNGIVTPEEKTEISSWLASGKGNSYLDEHLFNMLAGKSSDYMMETAAASVWRVLTGGISIVIDSDSEADSNFTVPWSEAAQIFRALYEKGLSGFTLEAPVQEAEPVVEGVSAVVTDDPVELDFDTVAQTVLGRVMADADYAETLANAKNRASLRNPCTWALEQSVRDHEADEPEVYRRYFSDDDFNDNLFDFVLKQSWANRPMPEAAVTEQPTQYDGFTEITDPAELAEIEAIFGDGKPKANYIVGQRVVLDLREKLRDSLVHDAPFIAGEFIVDEINGDSVVLTAHYKDNDGNNARFPTVLTLAEVERYTVQPVAEKLHDELSPSGKDTTAYYLLKYPNGINAGAVLDHETLALIKDRADTYVICAEACHLAESEMAQYNIGFRKMPRDWNLLPDTVQTQIRAIKPEYETQWQAAYGALEGEREKTREILYGLTDKLQNGSITYTDVNKAARFLNLKLAEFGNQDPELHNGGNNYAFWNESGNRNDSGLLRADYVFSNGRAEKVVNVEIDFAAFGIEPPPADREQQAMEHETPVPEPMQTKEGYRPGDVVRFNDAEHTITAVKPDGTVVMRETDGSFLQYSPEMFNAAQYSYDGNRELLRNRHESKITPSYEQHLRAKDRYPDHVAVTTNGDFNELHGADALLAANAFGYTLSYLNVNSQSIPFASIPKSDADTVMARLNERGCDVVYVNTYGAMAVYPHNDLDFIREQLNTADDATSTVQKPTASNFRITDDHLGEGGAKTKFRNNIAAITLLRELEREQRDAAPNEQEILSRYVGWGGIPQAFDHRNQQWENEYRELNALLTPEEWKSAYDSTLNAHYTPPIIIKAMYETIERMGFRTGNMIDPGCGTGHFFGLLPESMKNSKLYGVELDSVTARIAKQLYPNVTIQQNGYEKTDYPDAFFDVAIGNVPFGDYGVVDKRYDKHKFKIHDYFFAKTLDQVRPGGVVAFVTSKWTMDKQNPEIRKYIAQKAELLGAVRLPNNAFLKNAGTEIATDIIFLQKRERPLDIEPEWVHLGLTEDEIPLNRYFLDNPEMVLGKMAPDERMNNKYGTTTNTTCYPIEGADLAEQLKTALSYIQGQYTAAELDDLDGVDNHAIPADASVKNFSYALVTPATDPDNPNVALYAEKIGEGQVYFRENSMMYPVDLPVTTLERIRGMVGLRDCVQKLIQLQLDDRDDADITAQQGELNTLYDRFTAEYGLINSTANSRAFNADSAYYLLCSLENIDEDGKLKSKADMFTKRTIKQKSVVTRVDTASEALAVSLGEKARVDLAYMSELTGMSEDKLKEDLQGIIYLNIGSADSQEKAYVTADEYLSGNIRKKLESAEAAAKAVPSLNVNVEALKAVMPKDLDATEIDARLGATWIDTKTIQQFMYELLDTSRRNQEIYKVIYHPNSDVWQITGKKKSQYSDINATVTYGTQRMNAYQILDDTLNLRDVRVYDYTKDADGKTIRTLNKKETTLAQQKQELIKREFRDWLWKDPERRQTLVRDYNEKFNSERPREYDGSHIQFVGANPEINFLPHQIDAVARQMYGGNTLLAHVVGAGKTFEMVAAAMESKRLGLCNKSLFAVPNHLTEQWASEFLRLYPNANILVARKKDFEMRNRKKFCAKIATGDYDAVIIGHSQLEKIPMSRERQERLINEQIWEIEDGIQELEDSEGEHYAIKQLARTKKSLEARLHKLLESKTRDDVVTFEQLGVDRLFVDEAHNYKNLFMFTKMRNVAGLSTSEAQKSSDLFMKCRYMDELTDGKGIIFATGTPISNTMAEMFTLQRYLQHDKLEEKGLSHFDCWASIFGETTTSIELAPEGTGYRARTRFARFHNLPELMCMFKEVADVQTADMLNLPVPKVTYETVVVEPSELQKEMVQALSERAARVQKRMVKPDVDNMLRITTDGRKIGLDQRLINPLLPDFEGSKINACVDNVLNIWNETRAERLTQLVFCDFSTPKKGQFNVYDDIKGKLLERGIPESEIAFIHDANTDTQKKELFAKVRQGKVRVLIGSTFKMGAGTNVQDRLVASHDADCPWRPADLEQRSGRIVRQGNKNAEVKIFRYATNGTFDSYLWQTVENKQRFISQVMTSKSPARSCEDVDETVLSYAEIKALCAGNPLIAEKMNLDIEVAKLRMLKSEYNSLHFQLEDAILKHYPSQIASTTERIAGLEKDIALYTAQKEKCVDIQGDLTGGVSASAVFPGMTVNGVEYHEKEPAAKALLEACKGVTEKGVELPIGEYMGFKMSLKFEYLHHEIQLLLRGSITHQVELGTDAFGNITRINNTFDALPKRLEGAIEQLAGLEKQKEAAKLEYEKPFTLTSELNEKETRLALINSDLNIDGDGDKDVVNDEDEREPGEEPDEDDFDDWEPDDESDATHERLPAAASAKGAKPSILDGIRNYDSGKKPSVPGGTKSAERDI